MRAAEIMQKGIISVSPELRLAEFEELLTGEDIGGAPVLGPQGEILGIASKTDVIRALAEEAGTPLAEVLGTDLRVEDVMTREVVIVAPDDPVEVVARRMLDAQVHRVLVCEGDVTLGIITTFDLLKVVARQPAA